MIDNGEASQIEKSTNIFNMDFLRNYFNKKKNVNEFDIILIGYNPKIKKKPSYLEEQFIELNTKYEIMQSMAAYKTHNILTSENRKILSLIDIL